MSRSRVKVLLLINSFFANVGVVLAELIPPPYNDNGIYRQLYSNIIDLKSMKLSKFGPATIHEVSKIIDNLNWNTPIGLDGISVKYLNVSKN